MIAATKAELEISHSERHGGRGHLRRKGWKVLAVLLAAALLSAAGSPANARLVRIIDYEELFARADLIVIARPVGKTADTREVTVFDNMGASDSSGRTTPTSAIGVVTNFRVIKVIRGHVGPSFVLHHFREASPLGIELNGPNLVTFDDSDGKQRDILLFLRREPDGRYAPYGGQTDPALRSVQALGWPNDGSVR